MRNIKRNEDWDLTGVTVLGNEFAVVSWEMVPKDARG